MVGFVGCGNSVSWYRPGGTLKQIKQDCRECHYQAQAEAMEAAYRSKLDQFVIGYDRFRRSVGPGYRDLQFDRCMKQKGYRLVTEEEVGHARRKRLFNVTGEWYYSISSD
jgi:hypothetical protein